MDSIAIEAFNVVAAINELICERFYSDPSLTDEITKRMEEQLYLYSLELMSNGDGHCIEFLGTQIWNSEDDQREYDDDKDCYMESLETFVRKEIVKVLFDLNLIKNYLGGN